MRRWWRCARCSPPYKHCAEVYGPEPNPNRKWRRYVRLGDEEVVVVCTLVATAEYCAEVVGALGRSVAKTLDAPFGSQARALPAARRPPPVLRQSSVFGQAQHGGVHAHRQGELCVVAEPDLEWRHADVLASQ